MNRLSPNFKRSEFACKCGCGFDTVDVELLNVAELIRSEIGAYTPNSGCRCKKYNKTVGGYPKSKHTIGRAMDVPTDNPNKLYNMLNSVYPNTFGLGLYKTFVHVDTREKKARWKG